jgi:hypothetical protein
LEYDQTGFDEQEQPDTFVIKPVKKKKETGFYPLPPWTRKAPKPPLACGFVTTKRPNRVGERAGNAQGGASRDCRPNAVLAGPEGGRPRSNRAAVVFPLVVGSTHTKLR